MNNNYRFLLSVFCFFFIFNINGQVSVKLNPDGNFIKIIGTRYSVNYDNNQPSTTTNTKADVFDNNLNTFFASYDRSYTWVGLDLGEKHIITKIAYCPRRDHDFRLELGVFEGANNPDFGDAIPLFLIPDIPEERKMTEQTIENSRGFRYVRYIGPNDFRCNIAEIAFYGYKEEGDDSKLTQITNIPDVIIHTVNAQEITSKEEYIKGIISFISEDGTKIYTDSLEIRGRGNNSWTHPKKPYRIKLATSTNLLGNPAKARNWTLINNYGDKTLMRNLMAFDISKRLQMPYTPAAQAVNVFLNGEYKGCYQLCDHIDVRENRIDIKEMKSTDISGENLTGGYALEIDAYAYGEAIWFSSNRGTPVTIKSPDDEKVTQHKNYIRDHFNKLEAAVFSSNFTNFEAGFRRYMDTETFVRHFLVGEFCGNTDTYWSVRIYKQRSDDKFYFGPVWDYDLAFENDWRTYPINDKNDWVFRSGGSGATGMRDLIDRLLSDPLLYKELQEAYSNYRDWGYITEEKLLEVVDYYATEIDQSQKLNFKRWNIMDKAVHENPVIHGSYKSEVANVRNYIKNRIAWMDNKLKYVPDPENKEPVEDPGDEDPGDEDPGDEDPGDDLLSVDNIDFNSVKIFAQNHTIYINGISELTFIEVINLVGQVVEKQTVNKNTLIPIKKGIYTIRLYNQNKEMKVTKCLVT